MLLVQQYLETHSFADLAREHGVYASFSKSGHKWSLNYDQIEAKEADPIAQESRGLILAREDGSVLPVDNRDQIIPGKTKILAFPMRRFFNEGQGSAAAVDWNDPSLKIFEKLDGSLIIVYYDWFTKNWCAATRAVPEADLLMDNGIYTFRTLFEKAVKDTLHADWEVFTNKLDKHVTYCFELTTPYNQIVVKYPECRITLIAARDIPMMLEIPMDITPFDEFPRARTYKLNDVQQVLEWVSTLNPLEHEGVVVMDSSFNRIKVKNANYLALNKVRDSLATSERNCVELILAEKDDDALQVLPEEIANNLKKIKAGVASAIKQYDAAYQQALDQANATNPGDKKTFAILVTRDKRFWTAPFFQMFDGKASSMKDFISKNKKCGTWPDSFLDKILEISKIPEA